MNDIAKSTSATGEDEQEGAREQIWNNAVELVRQGQIAKQVHLDAALDLAIKGLREDLRKTMLEPLFSGSLRRQYAEALFEQLIIQNPDGSTTENAADACTDIRFTEDGKRLLARVRLLEVFACSPDNYMMVGDLPIRWAAAPGESPEASVYVTGKAYQHYVDVFMRRRYFMLSCKALDKN